MPPALRSQPVATPRRDAARACAACISVLCVLGASVVARAQDGAPSPVQGAPEAQDARDAQDAPGSEATPAVDEARSDEPPPPAADADTTDKGSTDGVADAEEPGPATPEPPQSYRLPAPPVGARYPGMDDLRSGSPFGGDEGELRLPIRISTRLRVLSTDLEALSSEGGSSTANGVLSMVTGGLVLALGALTDDEAFSTFLYVFGATTILRGGVDMIVTPDASEPALQYSHMPMRNITEVRQRLNYGERGLGSLADGFRLARILDGSLSLAAGVITIPLVLAPKDFKFENTLDIFVVVGAGISILSGIISLLSRSEAERRDAAYRKLRRKLQRPPQEEQAVDLAVGVAPTPGGALLHLTGRF